MRKIVSVTAALAVGVVAIATYSSRSASPAGQLVSDAEAASIRGGCQVYSAYQCQYTWSWFSSCPTANGIKRNDLGDIRHHTTTNTIQCGSSASGNPCSYIVSEYNYCL